MKQGADVEELLQTHIDKTLEGVYAYKDVLMDHVKRGRKVSYLAILLSSMEAIFQSSSY